MQKNTVDVYFYVNNKQKTYTIDTIASCIAGIAGVLKTSVSPRVSRLLAVQYDPSQVSSSSLAKFIQASGYQAAMVGM
jgi:hypothetical protein